METLLSGGRVIDPGSGFDRVADVLIRDGKIVEIGDALRAPSATRRDCAGKVVAPAFVDVHVHFREPGQEHKEDLDTGARAAARGGFGTVCCMPNTSPVNDQRAVTELIVRRAREINGTRIYPIGAISKGLKGDELTEMGELKQAGCVAVSDDGRPVMNSGLMRRALEYARTFDLLVVQHAEDLNLSAGGCMHEGRVSTRAGLRGQPAQAESAMVVRDLELVELTGARYHVAHVSALETVRAVREAKRRGLPVSCEVTPHHFTLTDEACATYDTHCKMAPPLRDERHRAAMLEALADGTIDCIATDHAPHAREDKEVEFETASFGITGLETAFALGLRLVEQKVVTLPALLAAMTSRPAALFGLDAGRLTVGGRGDVVVLDLKHDWRYDARAGASRSHNSPFDGWDLRGAVVATYVGGRATFDAEARS